MLVKPSHGAPDWKSIPLAPTASLLFTKLLPMVLVLDQMLVPLPQVFGAGNVFVMGWELFSIPFAPLPVELGARLGNLLGRV